MQTPSLNLDTLGMDSATLHWLKQRLAMNQPPVWQIPLETMRAGLEKVQAQYPDKPRALCDDLQLPVGPAGTINVRFLRPSGVPGKLPVAVYLHGGGWVNGSPDTHDRLARDIVSASGVALAVPRYSRSPEARYPQALEETYAVCAWLAEHGGAIGLDGSRLAVMGDSAGATIAAATAILAKRRGGPSIRHQTLLYPATDASCSHASYEEFATGLNLTREAMRWFWDQYAPDPKDQAQDLASIGNAKVEDMDGLPPALVVTAEFDVLRDEGEAYARKLAQAGVAVSAMRCLGTIHGFAFHNALAGRPAVKASIALIAAALKEHLKA